MSACATKNGEKTPYRNIWSTPTQSILWETKIWVLCWEEIVGLCFTIRNSASFKNNLYRRKTFRDDILRKFKYLLTYVNSKHLTISLEKSFKEKENVSNLVLTMGYMQEVEKYFGSPLKGIYITEATFFTTDIKWYLIEQIMM